jgi:hypothetical protein
MEHSVTEWLTGRAADSRVCWIRDDQLAMINSLFEFRHQLVHEIGISTMGHPNVRDAWSPQEARTIGGVLLSVISGIEAAFTHFAPRLFPNLLDGDRYPISPVDNLIAEFDRLDCLVHKKIIDAEWDPFRTEQEWEIARTKFREYLEAEIEFVDGAGMLHWRYFDARTPLKLELLRYRIKFLTDLLSNFSADDEEEGECGRRTH